MKYRSDIDGLRAVAVMLVVLFHCGFDSYIPGGFIGVDVFFVISGYLITKILYDEAEKGRLDIWVFYARRARRIFPALIAMYAFVLTASFFVLMPSEVVAQAKSVVSSIFFSSNIYFYHAYDYFDASSEFNAVLHTWSLSVEEQFYIFFPPILFYLVTRFRRFVRPLLAIGAIVSLGIAQVRLGTDPSAVFYMVWYRAWELMLGSLIAVGAVPALRHPVLASAAAGSGLAMILASSVMLSRSSLFPGLAALPSCLGAALIIWGGQARRNVVGWALGLAPARFVGKISYSLYLWHWPIWIIGRQVYEPANLKGRLAYLAVMIVVAVLSWRFVEQPFRHPAPGQGSRRVVGMGVAALAGMAVLTLATPLLSSVVWQVSPRVEEVAQFIRYRADKEQRIGTCFLTSEFNEFRQFDQGGCLHLDPAKPNVLLFGDSHAAQYYPGLHQFSDLNILQATASGCRPVPEPQGPERCTQMMRFITQDFLPANHLDAVVVAARWQDADLASISDVVRDLKKHASRVIVMGPIVEYQKALPRVLAKSLYENDPDLTASYRTPGRAELDDRMRSRVAEAGGEYVSVLTTLCPEGRCDVWTADGNPIQADYGHLTEGSKLVMARLSGAIHGVQVGSLR